MSVANIILATDPVEGLVIQSVITDSGTMEFPAEPLFTATVYDDGSGTMSSEPSSAGWTIETSADGDTLLIDASFDADPTLKVNFGIECIAAGLRIVNLVLTDSVDRGVAAISFQFLINPAVVGETTEDNLYLVHNRTSGHVFRRPNAGTVASAHGPVQNQFASFYGSTTNRHCYFWWDDVETQPIFVAFQGLGTVCIWSFTFIRDRWFEVGGSWSRPFALYVETFVGEPIDGTRGHEEASLRYSEWACDPARPWRTDGLWADDATIDPTLFGLEMFIATRGKEYTRTTTDFIKWIAEAGFTHMAAQFSGWKKNDPGAFEQLQEAYTPEITHANGPPGSGLVRAETIAMFQALEAAGIKCVPYINMRELDSGASAGYAHDAFFIAGVGLIPDLSAYLMKRTNGDVRVSPFTDVYGTREYRTWDYGTQPVAIVQLLAAQIITDYLAKTSTSFTWAYLDAFGAFLTSIPSIDESGEIPADFNHDPAATGWLFKNLSAGFHAFTAAARTTLNAAHGTTKGVVYEEWPSHKIGNGRRLQPLKERWVNQGNPCGVSRIVHGDVTRFTSYDYGNITSTSLPTSVVFTAWFNDCWHATGGVIAFQDSLDGLAGATGQIFNPTLETSDMYYFIRWMQKLKAANVMCRDYWEGRAFRSLIQDWQKYRNENSSTDFRSLASTESVFRSSTHKSKDRTKLGIISSYAFPDLAALRPADVAALTSQLQAPKVKTLHIDTRREELSAGRYILTKRVDGGAPVEVAAFRDELEVNITFDPWTVVLLEAIPEESIAGFMSYAKPVAVQRGRRRVLIPSMYSLDEDDVFDLLFGTKG